MQALLKEVATLHDTVAYGTNLIKTLNSTEVRIEQALEHKALHLLCG